jgi:hypothetical protein
MIKPGKGNCSRNRKGSLTKSLRVLKARHCVVSITIAVVLPHHTYSVASIYLSLPRTIVASNKYHEFKHITIVYSVNYLAH